MKIISKEEWNIRIKQLHDMAYQLQFDSVGLHSNVSDKELDKFFDIQESVGDFINAMKGFNGLNLDK